MIRVACLVACVFLTAGCATPTRSWPDQDRGLVWTAMVAAAGSPEYVSDDPRRRWIVAENNVDADPDLGRIQVHRVLTRSLQLPRQVLQSDRRRLFFDIYLLPTNPPTVTFAFKETGFIPVRVIDEADRYFSLVESILHNPIR